jgi:hypothetical protein
VGQKYLHRMYSGSRASYQAGFTTLLTVGALGVEEQQPGIRDVRTVSYMVHFVGVQKNWTLLLLFLLYSQISYNSKSFGLQKRVRSRGTYTEICCVKNLSCRINYNVIVSPLEDTACKLTANWVIFVCNRLGFRCVSLGTN